MSGKSIFKSYSGLINLFSRVSDPILIVIAACIAFRLKFSVDISDIQKDYKLLILFVFICSVAIFPLFDLYGSWRGQSLLKQAKSILLSWVSVIFLVIITLFTLKISSGYSRIWLGYWAIIGLLLLLTFRFFIFGFLHSQRRKGKNIRQVIIVGAGDLGRRAMKEAHNSPWMGYRVISIFDDSLDLQGQKLDGCKVVGSLDDVNEYLSNQVIDEVWLALPLRAELRMKKVLNDISLHAVNVKFIPDIFGFTLMRHSMTEIAGLPAVNLSVSPMDGSNRLIKETEDRVLAFIILVLLSPVMFLMAIGVKFSSSGPIFFKQERVSWNGTKFKMFKFRSMPVNDDKNSVWGNAKDKKTTKFGRFLRKTSLDELPQFYNVLKGDMSIVGPRPERSQFVEKFKYEIPGYMQKHMVKAGITGWAQINGWRGDTCLKSRIEHDLFYIENWSIWFDFKIIFLTIFKGFFNKS